MAESQWMAAAAVLALRARSGEAEAVSGEAVKSPASAEGRKAKYDRRGAKLMHQKRMAVAHMAEETSRKR